MSECGSGGSWEGLKEALDAEDRSAFLERLEACMRMKKTINIKKVSAACAKNIGASYGPVVERILRRTAMNTNIQITGD